MPVERKALITGGGGFAGSHLFDLLSSRGWEVTLYDLAVDEAFRAGRGDFIRGDVTSREQVADALARVQPDVVYHLAGIAFVPHAERDRERTLSVNLMGGLNVLEALRDTAPGARVVVISSSEVYGKVGEDRMPIAESVPVRPQNFYAFTKAALENAAFFAAACGMRVTVLRPFNHIGPRQSDLFVASAFARQVAEAEAGLIPPVLKVGNLEAVRDFTDVEDTARAYLLAGERDLERRVYNVCSGKGVKIQTLLDLLLEMAHVEIRVEQDPGRLRASDMPVLIGSSARFSQETGWKPAIGIEASMERILSYWRARLSRKPATGS
jgi:GDP-4-dehydro-6-deoxy-D-mannose reductase